MKEVPMLETKHSKKKDRAVKPCRSKCGAHILRGHAHSQHHAPEIIFPIKVGKNRPPSTPGWKTKPCLTAP